MSDRVIVYENNNLTIVSTKYKKGFRIECDIQDTANLIPTVGAATKTLTEDEFINLVCEMLEPVIDNAVNREVVVLKVTNRLNEGLNNVATVY